MNPQNPGTKGAEPSRPKGAVHKGTHLPSDNALRAMSIKSALRIYLFASYVMIGILRYDRHSAVETIQPRLEREEMHPYPRLRRYFPRWGKSALRLPYC